MSIGTIYGQIDFPLFLILGETAVARFFPKRRFYWLRLLLVLILAIGTNFGFYFLKNSISGTISSNFLYLFSAFLIFLITLMGIPFCYKATIPSYLLAGTIGYCIQNSSYCLMSTIRVNLPIDETENWYYLFLMLLAIFGLENFLIYHFYLKNPSNRKGIENIKEKRQIFITFFTILALSVLSSYGMKEATISGRKESWLVVYLFNTVVCAISMTSELELLISHRTIKESTRIKTMYEKDKENFKQANENIEMVNIKVHDLKHRLDALGNKISEEELDTLKKSMNVYEQIATTNCPAFDLVLKEKSLAFTNDRIRFTCFLDAGKINYIPKESLYSIFENAISNAIEAVKKLPEEKRIISVTGNDYGDYLSIHFENFCSPDEKAELGITSNQDKINHGFGLKSIKINVEENGGRFSVKKEGDIFSLDLLFRIKTPEE